jgi:PPP family 3-phenylpropionic acid transporter
MRESTANTAQSWSGSRARFSAASAYLAACAALGIQSPFFPLFLAERGLSPDAISLALALPMAIRLAAMPLAGVVSDHWGAPRLILMSLGVLGALGFVCVGLAPNIALILFSIALAAVFWTAIFPLLDA